MKMQNEPKMAFVLIPVTRITSMDNGGTNMKRTKKSSVWQRLTAELWCQHMAQLVPGDRLGRTYRACGSIAYVPHLCR